MRTGATDPVAFLSALCLPVYFAERKTADRAVRLVLWVGCRGVPRQCWWDRRWAAASIVEEGAGRCGWGKCTRPRLMYRFAAWEWGRRISAGEYSLMVYYWYYHYVDVKQEWNHVVLHYCIILWSLNILQSFRRNKAQHKDGFATSIEIVAILVMWYYHHYDRINSSPFHTVFSHNRTTTTYVFFASELQNFSHQ